MKKSFILSLIFLPILGFSKDPYKDIKWEFGSSKYATFTACRMRCKYLVSMEIKKGVIKKEDNKHQSIGLSFPMQSCYNACICRDDPQNQLLNIKKVQESCEAVKRASAPPWWKFWKWSIWSWLFG